MADVRERAQLFLVGAFALAVLFVALAVLLNAAIFTENLATQGSSSSPGEAIEHREAAVDAGGGTIEGVNYNNNSSYADLDAALDRGVAEWSDAASKHRASQGHAASAAVAATTNGTRLTQDTERNFTDAVGAGDWTVAEDVGVRNFTANVTRSSLRDEPANETPDGYEGSDNLYVEFEDGDGDVWTAYVHEDAGANAVAVAVVDDGGTLSTCQAPSAPSAVIDFTGASVGGEPCGALDFYGAMDDPYTIRYGNATEGGSDTGTGTYSLVVDVPETDTTSLDTSTSLVDDTLGGQPYYTPAVYDATIEITYRAPDTDYRAAVRVAPGEPDA